MSWSREHPDLVGHPDYDPWMQHEGYRKVAPMSAYELQLVRDEAERIREQEREER